jgi:hypothetical protein
VWDSNPRSRLPSEDSTCLRPLGYCDLLSTSLQSYILFHGLELQNNNLMSIFIYMEKISLSTCLWLYSPCKPWALFQFFNPYTDGRTPWTGINTSEGVYRHTEQHKHTNKHSQISMPLLGFELMMIPMFEQVKTVLVLDRSATAICENLTKLSA